MAKTDGWARHARRGASPRLAVVVIGAAGLVMGGLAAVAFTGNGGGLETAAAPLQVPVVPRAATSDPSSRSMGRDEWTTGPAPQASLVDGPTPAPTTAAPQPEAGQGTGEGSQPPSPPPGTPTSPPPGTPPAPPPSAAEQIVADIVTATNQQRAANGLGSLSVSGCATEQLDERLAVLLADGGFYHPDGLENVMTACGFSGVAENLALGYTTGAGVVDGWMNSQGHRENLLGSYTTMGVQCVLQDGRWLCGAVYGR